ncbi:MAG: hypothetical protein ACRDWY_12560 [Actinomycetes bacterium]
MRGLLVGWSLRSEVHDLRDRWELTVLAVVVLVGAAWLVRRRRTWLAGLCLLLASLFWLAVDGAVEGPTLLRLGRRHGLTLADLVPVVVVVAAIALGRRDHAGE